MDDKQPSQDIAAELAEALRGAIGVMTLQRDVIERGQHAAAWNPVIRAAEEALQKYTQSA